jgi:phosphopantetheinyl transferase
MTQKQFNQEYKKLYPHYKVMTFTDRRLYYNDLMEQYARNGQITEYQRNNWGHPSFLTAYKLQINCSKY